ncbi:hypothetical protein LVB87_10840 [Lysobacter sp. KIS68-7]|uniref:hypothetical protein n=1 Tax=Lysobacter sp. KIS68-7 TaxID=2904252 RepID=UPI001E41135A|nr:hypothetical protein [Lysobacter sp. KIS68-7]UHQ18686.1 hypothetical protein LVB87_10840 [Lysobacter sp. KIS68-7]
MHCFRLSITAGEAHRKFPPGTEVDAICLVDSADADVAMQKAANRLTGLGWRAVANVKSTLQLPPDTDISGYSDELKQAYADAKRFGVSLIVYPPGQQ